MSGIDPGALTIADATAAIRDRRLRAADLVAACFSRIDARDADVASFISLRRETAFAEADEVDRRADGGEDLPPLAGIPISVKDVIDVAGVPTTGASRYQAGFVPARDAAVVARLRDAGAVVIGKANCHELSFGGPSFDLFHPPARNPWSRAHFPGGSSSGSAVGVASGFCLGSVGTDTAGSIRLPATLCGIVGLKPSFGACSLDGVRPLAPTLDHCGPLARRAADAAALFAVMREPGAPRMPPRLPLGPLAAGDGHRLHIGIPGLAWGLRPRLDTDVARAFDAGAEAFARMGAGIVELALPALEDIHAAAATAMMAEVNGLWGAPVRDAFTSFGRAFRGRALLGAALPEAAVRSARAARTALGRAFGEAIAGVDALLLPGAFTPAVELRDVHGYYFLRDPILNIVANFAGHPAIAFPAGLSGEGLPVGLQLLGPHGSEEMLVALVGAFETAGFRAGTPPAAPAEPAPPAPAA